MQPEQSEEGGEGEKPIGLPDSLRDEVGDGIPLQRRPRSPALIEPVPAPPEEAEGLPLWAVVFFAGAAWLAASWLAVMASVTLRALGWA